MGFTRIFLIKDPKYLAKFKNGNHVPGLVFLLVITITVMNQLPWYLTPKQVMSIINIIFLNDNFITVPYMREGMVPLNLGNSYRENFIIGNT